MRFPSSILSTASSILLVAALACSKPRADTGGTGAEVDSIALERTRCFGTCAAYRVSATRGGAIHFLSRNPQDSGRLAVDSVPADGVRELQGLLRQGGEVVRADLPPRTDEQTEWCSQYATDNPTAVLTVYSTGQARRFEDYLGCHAEPGTRSAKTLDALRALELAIDSAVKVSRWVTPARMDAQALPNADLQQTPGAVERAAGCCAPAARF